jgi:hypothetical protein
MGPISYTLTAFNADGATATSTRTLPVTSSIWLASALLVSNGYTDPVNVFLINAEDNGGVFVGTLVPNASLQITIPNCRVRMIVSLDPELVSDYNARWETNYSATAVSTARDNRGLWLRRTDFYYRGLATGPVVGPIYV